jgi:hypothetical protein
MSLLSLPVETLFNIYRRLGRPSQLSLGLTSPQFLAAFAAYFHLDRFRDSPSQWKKLGLPEGASWHDPAGQATIIRYLTLSGSGDITSPSVSESGDDDRGSDTSGGLAEEVQRLHEEADEAWEYGQVEEIISAWLMAIFNVEGGCVVCADCGRYILCQSQDLNSDSWVGDMLGRP